MREDLRVEVENLRRVCNPENFKFQDTSEVGPFRGFIGQERAVQALKLGLEVDNPEYNIYVAANTGVSRKSVLMEYLNKDAEEKSAGGIFLRDFCYLCNFEKLDEPKLLIFPKGGGRKFKTEIDDLLTQLCQEIPAIFESAEYKVLREDILIAMTNKHQQMGDDLNNKMRRAEFMIVLSYPFLTPISKEKPGEPMGEEEKKRLSKEDREELEKKRKKLQTINQGVSKKMHELKNQANAEIKELEEKLISQLMDSALAPLCVEYANLPEAVSHLHYLKEYILCNIGHLKPQGDNHNQEILAEDYSSGLSLFRVNLLIDNSKTQKMPVVFESNPTFENLFGKIEKKFTREGYYTDHTYIKPGSLALADGGYLVLNALDVLTSSGVWPKLKNTIRYGKLKIEDQMNFFGWGSANLNPEPIPVKVKVILVGEPWIYQLLITDPGFSAIFKIKVETDFEMPSTPENINAYAGFIALCCEKEDLWGGKSKLLPFDCSAVAKIAEQGFRLAGKQAKLSTEFNKIKELIIEADYWAKKAGSDKATADHVKQALEAQRLRANLIEIKLQEAIKEEMLLIDTQDEKVGQINGLVVYRLGDYSFGMPSRITAETFAGKAGVVSIDREVKMSGPIHDKGVHIFSGYFNAQYGKVKPVSFSASICFEQCYGGIEGDSASAAELFCLISSLANLPINQGFAVTGSVNQKGEIQPIGGVNEKIEGFFDVCKERGLTGSQGAVIPHQNVKNLMLREDVVEACKKGEFSVHAIKTVEDGFELLMNQSAGRIHAEVKGQLKKISPKEKKEV